MFFFHCYSKNINYRDSTFLLIIKSLFYRNGVNFKRFKKICAFYGYLKFRENDVKTMSSV